ncbi:MAG: hypothetical protein E7082_00045 [Bacteroidales bacterium]|nr:hypothetical protein [Bacteroidales bacterium]
MTTPTTSNTRIAKNTAMLYIRMLILMGVNLFAMRIVLEALGEEDFGIYSLVGGIAAFLGFINASMAAAAMRYQSYEKGLEVNRRNERGVFSSILLVQGILALFILIFGEIFGVWYVANQLNAPESRISAAQIVFQFALFQFIAKTLSTPYTSSILANEKMDIFAYLSLIEGLLQLGAAYATAYLPGNKLTNYALLMFCATAISQFTYIIIAKTQFQECRYSSSWQWCTVRSILQYSGWNLLGAFSSVCIGVGVNMVLNYFFGLIVNAARGIAMQVNAAVSSLATNFQQALNPQIIKSYAANDSAHLNSLIINGTRLCFFMLAALAVPCGIFMKPLLEIWLTEVPNYTVGFCQLILVATMFTPLSGCLMTAAMASDNIKKYQITVASINLLNIPLTIIAFKFSTNPYWAMYIMIALAFFATMARLIITRSLIKFNVRQYLWRAFSLPIVQIAILTAVFWALSPLWSNTSFSRITTAFVLTFIAEIIYIYFVCMTSAERAMLNKFIPFKKKQSA